MIDAGSGGAYTCAMGGAAIIGLVQSGINLLKLAMPAINQALADSKREVYEYSKAARDLAAGFYDNHQPRVHHIVPWGAFSNRSTNSMVREMQQILWDVGIDPKNDPINLIVVSQGYHAHLHTDFYLKTLYTALTPAAGNEDAVKEVLF